MDYAYQPQDRSSRYRGLAIVVALHLLLAWALISGTARKGLEVLKKPLESVVIQEVFIPPLPAPAPPPKEIKPPTAKAPEIKAPPPPPFVPPPFVPPPEVAAPAAAPAIASTPVPPAAPPVIAPPAPAPVIEAPAPAPTPAPAPAIAKAPAKPDFAVDCPTQVKPEYPRKQLHDGVEGVIKVQALVRDGVVKEVTFLSGSRVFLAAVRSAMLQYKCNAEPAEYLVTQEFPFKIKD